MIKYVHKAIVDPYISELTMYIVSFVVKLMLLIVTVLPCECWVYATIVHDKTPTNHNMILGSKKSAQDEELNGSFGRRKCSVKALPSISPYSS